MQVLYSIAPLVCSEETIDLIESNIYFIMNGSLHSLANWRKLIAANLIQAKIESTNSPNWRQFAKSLIAIASMSYDGQLWRKEFDKNPDKEIIIGALSDCLRDKLNHLVGKAVEQ